MKEKQELGVYLHIPFCVRKCAYCDFLSFPAKEEEKERYKKALLAEIRSFSGLRERYRVRSVFFGGGTPSVLPAEDVELFLKALRRTLDFERGGIEITLEANPGTLTEDKLLRYHDMGINRLSMGLQSSVEGELRELGRLHTYEEFLANYQAARKAGFSNLNVDLMSALPGQTKESWEKTLRRIAGLSPEHISAYSLIIEENTPFHERYQEEAWRSRLPGEEEEREMYDAAGEILGLAGYERYEISNYAKKGRECRHNSSYWEGTDYLGLGLGASSYLDGERWHNEKCLGRYLEEAQGGDLRRNRIRLTVQERMEEFMFLGLRKSQGVELAEFERRFRRKAEEVYGNTMEKLQKEGLLAGDGKSIRLTGRGVDLSNRVLADFLL